MAGVRLRDVLAAVAVVACAAAVVVVLGLLADVARAVHRSAPAAPEVSAGAAEMAASDADRIRGPAR